MKQSLSITMISGSLLSATGCLTEDLQPTEMRAALTETVESGQVQQLENGIIEITTDFTIADGIEQVRQRIQEILVACSSTTVEVMDDVTILIDFGSASSPCAHDGKLYSGQVELVITWDEQSIDAVHNYTDLSNGTYTLNGTKGVVWSEGEDATVERRITDDVGWDGPRGHVDHQSDRTMTFMDWLGGPTQRIRIAGSHDWQRNANDWHLDVEDVEFRLIDPVPQSGTYTLITPEGKEASLSFERIDVDTIAVVISGGYRERVYHVTATGEVSDATQG